MSAFPKFFDALFSNGFETTTFRRFYIGKVSEMSHMSITFEFFLLLFNSLVPETTFRHVLEKGNRNESYERLSSSLLLFSNGFRDLLLDDFTPAEGVSKK
ncbi:hypothetical protein AVEN_13397-1 [Araneus ventricosus]|uniref:Uncharacterized protein n=1 Tax=Araneus ventricosus TaxID=182803 RepID=A0A4Y2X6L0_ARAVE|nr:hypothetical protein AVEN_13397-1 [Araneus ventricosus]